MQPGAAPITQKRHCRTINNRIQSSAVPPARSKHPDRMKPHPKQHPGVTAVTPEISSEERLARFGDRAGQHGPLAAVLVLIPVRVTRDSALRAQLLARRLGLRRATWAAQALAVASQCHPDDWFRAIAAFQSAQKTRAASDLVG